MSKKCSDPADPQRCQAVTARGQCEGLSVDNSLFCSIHSHGKKSGDEERMRHYLLSNPELQARLNRQAGIEEVRSLREEIHLARVMVETRLDLVEKDDRGDMLAAFSNINTYLATIDKLVNSCHRMEVSLGTLLSKASIFSLGREIVNILADELREIDDYEAIIDRISEKIVVAIAGQQNEEKT